MLSYNTLLRTGIYTGVNVAIDFGKGMTPDMEAFMDTIIYWVSDWIYKWWMKSRGMTVCETGGSCMSCTMRNVFIVVMELLYDAFMYKGMPGITDILQQITSVFTVDLVQQGLTSFKGDQ